MLDPVLPFFPIMMSFSPITRCRRWPWDHNCEFRPIVWRCVNGLRRSEAIMIDPAWCRTVARYNLWQNRATTAAAGPLGPVLLHDKRGVADTSIEGILSHLLWTDRVWLARFDGGVPPDATPGPMSMQCWRSLGWRSKKVRYFWSRIGWNSAD